VAFTRSGLANQDQHPRSFPVNESPRSGQHDIRSVLFSEVVECSCTRGKLCLGESEFVVPPLYLLPALTFALGDGEYALAWIPVEQYPPDIGMGHIEITADRTLTIVGQRFAGGPDPL